MKVVFKLLTFGVAGVLTFILIGYAMGIFKPAQKLQKKNEASAESIVNSLTNDEVTKYDNTDISGSALLDVINNNANDPNMEIIVITSASAANTPISGISYTKKETSEYVNKLTYTKGSSTGTISLTLAKKYTVSDVNDVNYINQYGTFHGTVKANSNGVNNAIVFMQKN